jgi:SAM-dependent methyltransferase
VNDLANPTLGAWPEDDLEWLGHCPACGAGNRSILFDDLTDRVCRVAPGRWTLWHCAGCGAAYLDPRPSEASNGRAYAAYYTHAALAEQSDGLSERRRSPLGALAQGIRNGYLNSKFGHRLPYAVPGATAVAWLLRAKRMHADHFIRHLPAPSSGSRLLDIGCANGAFLRVARTLGHEASGIEPDERSAAEARKAGFEVAAAGLPGSGLAEASFSHITLSHVFEHLHRPVEALEEAFRLLEPDGRLWLSFPNLAAAGLPLFGRDWVGLDPPRHLVLYDTAAIRQLLQRIGFVGFEVLAPEPVGEFYCRSSLLVRAGLDVFGTSSFPEWNHAWRRRAAELDRVGARAPDRAETLTVIAYRPRER